MKNGTRKIGFLILALSLALGACGRSARKNAKEAEPEPQSSSLSPIPFENEQREAAYRFGDLSISGIGGVAPIVTTGEVLTDNILRVTIEPETAGKVYNSNGNQNGQRTYSCVKFRVKLKGTSISYMTPLMAVNGGAYCPGAPAQATIDFSQHLGVGGIAPYQLEISDVSHNYMCGQWHTYRNYYGDYWANYYVGNYDQTCPSKIAHRNDNVKFTVRVQANGTLE